MNETFERSRDATERRHRAAIIGLGLMGGSLAQDLSASGWHVVGHDLDPETVRVACRAGAVHEPLPSRGPVLVDVVVFAVPVTALPDVLGEMAPRIRSVPLLMDVGSTKRSAIATAERADVAARFVGAHPMTGDHRSGWGAARRGMFEGQRVYLCATTRTRDEVRRRAARFWRLLGARVEPIDADDHDRLVARTSHVAQLVSKAFALALNGAGIARDQLGPGGYDVTRLAQSDPRLWTGIVMDNAEEVRAALDEFAGQLAKLRAAVTGNDAGALHPLLASARRWSGSAVSGQRSLPTG